MDKRPSDEMFDPAQVMIESATVDDTEAIYALLRDNQLPIDGLADHLATALVARCGDMIVGCVALECYGSDALLRSVAVDPNLQRMGIGTTLVQAAFALAHDQHIRQLYLLTETATAYFPRFGFITIERSLIPDSVKQSVEFTSACPDSAIAMVASLSG